MCARACCTVLALLALSLGEPAAAVETAPQQLFERIDAFFESERQASRIPDIAIAVVHEGRIAHVRGFGTRGEGQAVNGDTPFPVGSLTKSFTALLARQLAEAGRLDLDAPVQRVLPAFTLADAAAAQRITVRHLMNQTSGLSRTDGRRALLHGDDAQGGPALLRSLATLRAQAAPGERYEYSNLNFALLGQVVEAVSGQPWEQALRQRLFEPLAMTHSHTGIGPARADGLSELHRYWFGVPVVQRIDFPRALAPAGGAAASAHDMARYLLMMLNAGRGPRAAVLGEVAARSMLAPASPPARSTLLGTGFDFRYGEGWFVGPFGAAQDARWHLGSLTSFASWMVLLPDTRQGVVVLINASSELPLFGAGDAFSRIPIGVVNLLRGQPAPAGVTVADAYLRLNTALALIGAMVVGVSWWIARRGWRWAAIGWAATAVLLAMSLSFTAFGWRGFAQFIPDGVAWLATMMVVMLIPAALLMRRERC
jgi:CubicO group peptidase (beta-lactamase class C family)